MFGLPLDTILRGANILYLGALAVAAVASVAIYRLSAISSEQKDRQFAEYQQESRVQIVRAQAEGEQAREEAAKANERASGLEAVAAEARKEQERLRESNTKLQLELQKFANRRLTPKQAESLVGAISGKITTVVITQLGDMEAAIFADDFIAVFRAAGCQIQLNRAGSISPPPYGIRVAETGGRSGTLSRALADAELEVQATDLPSGQPPQMLIGLKSPPDISLR